MRAVCVATMALLLAASFSADMNARDGLVNDHRVTQTGQALNNCLRLMARHQQFHSVCVNARYVQAVVIITEDIW